MTLAYVGVILFITTRIRKEVITMIVTIKEMEALCIFHAGSLPATIEALQGAISSGTTHPRMTDITSLLEKLTQLDVGDTVCIAFESTG